MAKDELFLSVDIEADGQVPGLNSMLSLGIAAFTGQGEQIDSFYRTLFPLPGAREDPETMQWWKGQPEAWAETQRNRVTPDVGTYDLEKWLTPLGSSFRLVPVAWPAAFDYPFVKYYLELYTGSLRGIIGFACCDIRSFAAGLFRQSRYYSLRQPYIQKAIGELPKAKMAHRAIDDAIEQGILFCRLLEIAAEMREKEARAVT